MNRLSVIIVCALLVVGGTAFAQTYDFESSLLPWSSGENGGQLTAESVSEAPNQSGNHMKFTHLNGNNFAVSAASATVVTVDPNSTYQISCWMRVSNPSLVYWAELGWKLGNNTAANFNSSVGTWTLVTKFPDNGMDDDQWHLFTSTVTDTGSNTELTLGFKLGAGGFSSTIARFDTLQILKVGDPPDAVITTDPAGIVTGDVSIPYTLSDDDNADADASIAAEYAVKDEFLSPTLDIGVQWNTLGGSLSTDLTTTPGTLTVNGTSNDKSYSPGTITASILNHTSFGSGNFSFTMAITGITNDAAATGEGIGIAVVTPTLDQDTWFVAKLYYDGDPGDLRVRFESSVNGGAGSSAGTSIATVPTTGQPFLLRVERIGDGYRTRYDSDGAGFTALGADASFTGSPLASGNTVRVGITALTPGGSTGFSADIDYIMSDFRTATEGSGSDGTTGLASTSTGNAHTFVWDTATDVPVQLDGVVLRISPSDDDGTGNADTTAVFGVDNFDQTGVQNWNVYR